MSKYKPKEVKWASGDSWTTMEGNQTLLDQIDSEAKAKGELLWRYIQEPFADGYAVYQIVKVNKKTVRIRVCGGLGDDWIIPYWGEEATIEIEHARWRVEMRDNLNSLLSNQTQEQT